MSLMETTISWVVEKYIYNSVHMVNSLEWLDKIAPGSPEHVRIATVTHDMERAFPGPDAPICPRQRLNRLRGGVS